MELTDDQIVEKHGKRVCIVQETLYYHEKMIVFAFHEDTTLSKEKTNLQKSNENKLKFISRLSYADKKTSFICINVNEIYKGNLFNKKICSFVNFKN